MKSKIEQGQENREAVEKAVGKTPLSAEQVADKTKLTKATAARHLRKLVEEGYITSNPSTEDGRVVVYFRS